MKTNLRWVVSWGVVAAVALFTVTLGLESYRHGWWRTAGHMSTVAAAVKDATQVVRDTSGNAATSAKVKAALALSKRVPAMDVNVETQGGVVVLTGKVPFSDVKELAEQIAADTTGVKEVRNLLEVDASMQPEEDRQRLARRVEELERQTAIAEAIQQDPQMEGARVRVRVAGGGVSLEGTVKVDDQRSRAAQIARAFPGITGVIDRLQ